MAAPKLGLLGRVTPAVATDVVLYTPSSATRRAVVSSLVISNTNTTPVTYRVYLRLAGEAAAQANAFPYEMTLPGRGVDTLTWGIALDGAVGDAISVRASAGNVNFVATGQEEDIPPS